MKINYSKLPQWQSVQCYYFKRDGTLLQVNVDPLIECYEYTVDVAGNQQWKWIRKNGKAYNMKDDNIPRAIRIAMMIVR